MLVLRQVGQSTDGKLLTLVPRGRGEPVTIEKDALRPFLFGKDVERWHVDWQNWWVIFPYMETDTGFKLMPTEQYRNHTVEIKAKGKGKSKEQAERRRVFAGYPDDLPNLEELYPHLWAYLTTNEKALRGRESGKYKISKTDEWRWYELSYARSLDEYDRSKLLWQVQARGGKFVADLAGFFFTGGGTSGVNGLTLNNTADLSYFSSILNSMPAELIVRTTSHIFSGGFYSYGDQAIRDLPIPSASPEQRKRLSNYSQALTNKTGNLRQAEAKVSRFPESVNEERREAGKLPDLERLSEVAQLHNLAQNLDGAKLEDAGEALTGHLPGHTTLKLGNGSISLSQEHAELVKATLKERGSMKLEDLSELRVPESKREVQGYLDSLAQWKRQIAELSAEIEALESELNDVVYGLYDLTADERQVIESFLARY